MSEKKTAIVIGAGPAGLTAAYELLERTDIKPIVFEKSPHIGGISKTINYKGNRIDIGGHRFFSKSQRVMQWWLNILPVGSGHQSDQVMLVRKRLSRILYLGQLFDYPITLNVATLRKIGIARAIKIGLSYLQSRLNPIQNEDSLEAFFINRFGRELYQTFFKDYTEKVWGVPCHQIPAEWGAQRIKGLSVGRAVLHAAKQIVQRDTSISQKGTETSLIEQFLYPKFGPGQMWEEVARRVLARGGEIWRNHTVVGFKCINGAIDKVVVEDVTTGRRRSFSGGHVFSTMAIKDLIAGMGAAVPDKVQRVARGLAYRDFVTVGLLLRKLRITDRGSDSTTGLLKDNWIYVQESGVKLGRLQMFNNWSPYMVERADRVWLGLEYFCQENDAFWRMPDDDLAAFAIAELEKIGVIAVEDVLDHVVIREAKTYPAYLGTYDEFETIREFTDQIDNLYLIGRNGMHRYNNQDHSMLAAMIAVDNIVNGIRSRDNIWSVNTEQEYHE